MQVIFSSLGLSAKVAYIFCQYLPLSYKCVANSWMIYSVYYDDSSHCLGQVQQLRLKIASFIVLIPICDAIYHKVRRNFPKMWLCITFSLFDDRYVFVVINSVLMNQRLQREIPLPSASSCQTGLYFVCSLAGAGLQLLEIAAQRDRQIAQIR